MANTPEIDCTTVREAISAEIDGESPGLTEASVGRHVAGCASCQQWAEAVYGLHRITRVQPADDVPDLSAAIVARAVGSASSSAPARPWAEAISGWRWALFAVALTQLVLAGPSLLLGNGAGDAVHAARELGAFDVALAVGLLVAAWQPARAWGLLPLAAALAVVMVGTAVLDVVDGRTSTLSESHHILDLAGVALLWFVAGRESGSSPRRRTRSIALS